MHIKNDYIIKTVYRSFILISIITALVATMGMMIDNIVVGQFLGTDCLSAMGIVTPISLIFSAFGNVSSSGGVTIAARELGRNNKEKVCSIFTVTITYCLIIGAFLTLVGVIFTPQIAKVLGAKGDILQPTIDYLRGFFLGAIPTILMPTFMGFFKMDGSTKLPILMIAVMSVLDVVLDLFMAVVLKAGMFGMALATTLSYFAAVAVGFIHFKQNYNSLKLIKPLNTWYELKEMVGTGAPTAVNRVCDTLKTVLFNNMLMIMAGSAAVAALSVRSQVYNLVGSLIMGAGQALMPIVALFFGEKDEAALKASIKESIRIGLLLCACAMVVLLIFPSFFSKLLGVKDPVIIKMANVGIRFFALSMPFRLINVLWTSYYQSTNHSRLGMIISFLQSFLLTVIAAVVLSVPMKVNGIFLSYLVGEILTLAFIVIYILIKNKKANDLTDFMLIPDDFGNDIIDKWEISIGNDMNEVMELSGKILDGAKEKGKLSGPFYKLSLCIEEMAGNIVQHAFKPNEKKWFDVLILEKQSQFIVRMRDNGRMFNPIKYLQELPEGKEKDKFGINLIVKTANDVSYSRSIGLNNLIISIDKN